MPVSRAHSSTSREMSSRISAGSFVAASREMTMTSTSAPSSSAMGTLQPQHSLLVNSFESFRHGSTSSRASVTNFIFVQL